MATHSMTTRRGTRRGGRLYGVGGRGVRAALAGGMLVGVALAAPQSLRRTVVSRAIYFWLMGAFDAPHRSI